MTFWRTKQLGATGDSNTEEIWAALCSGAGAVGDATKSAKGDNSVVLTTESDIGAGFADLTAKAAIGATRDSGNVKDTNDAWDASLCSDIFCKAISVVAFARLVQNSYVRANNRWRQFF
ncbi:hypothetical protein BSLG_004923 [Batrachochytrium salamandrivorans]|nr:hypothetical protein BSLG_004923 [Batrachochytrium salamandrivorans]